MEKFNGDYNKRLPEEAGKDIRDNGKRLGQGSLEKDCYWSGYEKDGKYYISLNDSISSFWEVSYEDVKSHCL